MVIWPLSIPLTPNFRVEFPHQRSVTKYSRTSLNTNMAGVSLGLHRCKNLRYFFFVSLARAGVRLLFNGLLALLFSLFYVIREFERFLHRGWAVSLFLLNNMATTMMMSRENILQLRYVTSNIVSTGGCNRSSIFSCIYTLTLDFSFFSFLTDSFRWLGNTGHALVCKSAGWISLWSLWLSTNNITGWITLHGQLGSHVLCSEPQSHVHHS